MCAVIVFAEYGIGRYRFIRKVRPIKPFVTVYESVWGIRICRYDVSVRTASYSSACKNKKYVHGVILTKNHSRYYFKSGRGIIKPCDLFTYFLMPQNRPVYPCYCAVPYDMAERTKMDQEKIKQAVSLFLEGIGEDPEREGLADTPDRVARMCEEIFGGLDATPEEILSKQFSVEDSELVLVKDITFYSVCEHHLLPFFGKVHVAYIPDGKVVGLSKLARTIEVYARRPQIQEKLTGQIADALMTYLNPQGVMVMIEAEHTCMTMRGIKKPGSMTVTTACRGCLKDESKQDRILKMIGE